MYSDSREVMGDRRDWIMVHRKYNFPVEVFKVNEEGVKELVRVEQ
ncbi:hypothetical protein [Streptomyces sp. NBC_01500]|nr:hypothetical protein [Streptomyces sp. NBC_01500]MCX4554116.1 hypothetical protein [Streptomyces sp. NBC_01500]